MKKQNNSKSKAVDSSIEYSPAENISSSEEESKIAELENQTSDSKETFPNGDYVGVFLSVFSPFRGYKRGDLIFDQLEIKKILGSHEKHMVNKVVEKVKN